MDDSRAEFSAVSSVWPKTPIFLCTWHVLQNLTRHLSPASLSIANYSRLINSTEAEVVEKWKEIFDVSVKAMRTIHFDKHILYRTRVTELLAEVTEWWNTAAEHTLACEREWWKNYLSRANHLAIAFRVRESNLSIRYAALQDKATCSSERFHSMLKARNHQKTLKSSDIVQSLITILNGADQFNAIHRTSLQNLFFTPAPTSCQISRTFHVIFSLYPRSLHQRIVDEYSAYLQFAGKHAQTQQPGFTFTNIQEARERAELHAATGWFLKWREHFRNLSGGMSAHICKRMLAHGIPCRHLFLYIVSRPSKTETHVLIDDVRSQLHLYLANHRENVLSSMTVSRVAILEQSMIQGPSTTLSQYDPSLLPPSIPSQTRPVRVRFDGQYLDCTTTTGQHSTPTQSIASSPSLSLPPGSGSATNEAGTP